MVLHCQSLTSNIMKYEEEKTEKKTLIIFIRIWPPGEISRHYVLDSVVHLPRMVLINDIKRVPKTFTLLQMQKLKSNLLNEFYY